ncbi:hypothetical protein [Hymenobacter actinosclerus]|uniref:Uncharacterized protein n=1 Tax=Hymenobacter actinosclerus TaxID=82805 RepID=A0A1I0I0L8_9BACT|nr:hypothetical protein [Hymenobacter actinosclerus]SET90059.1 hypothetical protein SAMN04487998_3069 [Hymenobacter actinosclerus]
MAKSIKALKCPQCGSAQKTEVRPEHFRCDNCGTEYFLDNDDININYTERQTAPTGVPDRVKKLAAIAFGALFLLFLLSRLFEPDAPVYVAPGRPEPVAEQPADTTYRWMGASEHLYLTASGQPVLLVMGARRYEITGGGRLGRAEAGDSCYASFYAAETGQELKSVALPELNGESSPSLRFADFEGGDLYAIADEKRLYAIDKEAYRVQDVTKTLFQGQPELSSGVARLQPVHYALNDGFTVLTNDGRNLLFYPRINEVYTEKAYYKARGGMATLRPNSVLKTGFTFSTQSTNYPDEKLQLITYKYRSSPGAPQEPARFSWSRDYGRAGIFTGNEPHKKSLINDYMVEQARLLSYRDFTPGRLYFSPEVVAIDTGQVLIRFRPTAADDAVPTLQSLDAKTGAIRFTAPLPDKFRAEQVLRYPKGFIVRHDRTLLLLNPDGTTRTSVIIP